MPDTFPPLRPDSIESHRLSHDVERPSTTNHPRGLPVLSTEPLTSQERRALHHLGQSLRLAADCCDLALATGRVDRGLEACSLVGEIGVAAQLAASELGSNR
jgi:hypothetical protein